MPHTNENILMKKKSLLCGICLSLALLGACRHAPSQEQHEEGTLDLTGIAEETADKGADAFLRNCRWIPLETNEDCLLGQHFSLVSMTDSDLIMNSEDELYRFDCKGKFLNRIGELGHGHGEHGTIIKAFEHPESGLVYILSFGGKLTIYGKEGTFVGNTEILPPTGYVPTSAMPCPRAGIICELRRYKSDGLDVKLAWLDGEGKIERDTLIYSDRQSVSVDRGTFSLSYRVADTTLFKLDFEDKVYALSERGVMWRTINLGNLSPDRKTLEDMDYKKDLLLHKCQILDMKESGRYVYLIAFFGQKFRLLVLDKASGQTIFNREGGNPQKNEGLKVEGFSSLRVWPAWADGKRVAACVSPGFLEAADLAKLNEIAPSPYPVTADSNPVVLCAE